MFLWVRLWLWLLKEFLAYADSLVTHLLPLILTKPDNYFFPCHYLSTEYVCPKLHVLVPFSSFTQSWPALCDPMNHSTPGIPVHHQLPESTQTHVHWVGDAIQPSHPLSSPSPPALNISQHHGPFKWVNSSHQVAKVLEFQLQHQSFQWTPRTDL